MTAIVSVSKLVRESIDRAKACPREGCRAGKARHHYACKAHWFELPETTREKISRGIRADKVLWLEGHREALAFWRGEAPAP